MKIDALGGEFALIDRLADLTPTEHACLPMGIGDDAAVINDAFPNGDLLLVTTDMLVEDSHFRRDWATAEQIGIKSVACNASDIAAMGGAPTFMFVSLALAPDTDADWVQDLYRGMGDACHRYGIVLAGGDTTHGRVITINITLLGRVAPEHLCMRSQAGVGDLLCVTGPLGGSAAGLALLTAGLDPPPYLRAKHLSPGCRLDLAPSIAPLAGAMIDISDGLAAEVNHICNQSGTGAEVTAADIPVHDQVRDAARLTGRDPISFALSGGEDFELLFSITPENRQVLIQQGIQAPVVGRVTEPVTGCRLRLADGGLVPLEGGYNHFAEQ